MNRKDCFRLIQITIIALAVAAVCQELAKPKEARTWHGKVLCFVPYDFRLPNIERFLETYWNPYDRRVLRPQLFGIGWAVNFFALFENMGIIRPDVSEESYLMPSPRMKELLAHPKEAKS